MRKMNQDGREHAGADLRGTHASPPHDRHRLRVCGALLALVLGLIHVDAATADEAEEVSTGDLPFSEPYAFVDRFTNSPEVKALGFPSGVRPFLTLGMIVQTKKAEEAGSPLDIVSATATNGKVTIELAHQDIGIFELWDNWDDIQVFDAKKHLGTWIITATASDGSSASTQPVCLNMVSRCRS